MRGRRIVFLRRSLAVGGSERQLITLANGLAEKSFDVTVMSMYSAGVFASALDSDKVRLVGLAKRSRWDLAGFMKRLISECRMLRPDIVYGFSPTDNLFALLVKRLVGRPHVVWGIRASNVDLARYGLLPQLIFKLACLLSRFPDLIIANSCAGRDYHLARGFPDRKTVVIPNGIDIDYFRPQPDAGGELRAEWGAHGNVILIGLVGRFDPMKGHETFLRAAALLCREWPDVKFICVGDGAAYGRKLGEMAQGLNLSDCLIWEQARKDMPAVYSALDLCVSSSVFGEGFPNAIAEAMACGVPCVVTDVGDSAEIVADTGVVVPARDHIALAEGMRRLLIRLEREGSALRNRARQRIVEHFNSEKLAERTIAALAQLA